MAARNFKNLVFEGGGVKGIAYGGSLEVLDSLGILPNIERVGGTSAGAINAALLAVGYTHGEMSDLISRTDFSEFADGGLLVSKISRLWRNFGINKGDVFKNFIREKIRAKTGNPDFTFRQLAEKVSLKTPGFSYLYVIATDLTNQHPLIFSHEESQHPDTPIGDAVRMSMSIPLYFMAARYKESVMVDGGVSYNYAANIFDNKKYLSNPVNGDAGHYKNKNDLVFNYETLGFRLDSSEVIRYSLHDWAIPPQPTGNFKEFTAALLNFMMEMANKAHLVEKDWNRTIFIDTLDVRTTEFKISEIKIKALIKSGKECTEKYFSWRDKEWGRIPA
ncbi:MAG TPA: patatin-like phospholipase family protein [Cyclobacteriaceae bacterium]|nr:patatin-like phospholipase family protein [Cyclobacteriaceae bacterium]